MTEFSTVFKNNVLFAGMSWPKSRKCPCVAPFAASISKLAASRIVAILIMLLSLRVARIVWKELEGSLL